jgi:hypothetical protein
MAGLLERPTTETPQASATPPAAEPYDRLCGSCASPLTAGQGWCLECGTAQPGRLGGRPGWRAALAVLALTGVLASGAVAAAYAAMSSDARREAAAPPPPAAAPVVAPAPPAPPAPQPPVEEPKAEVPKAEAPAPPPAPPAPTPAPAPAPAAPTDTGGDGGAAEDADPEPVAIELESDAASTYDPFGRADESVTNADLAIDGKPKTAWRAPAASDGTVRMGLVVSLEKAQRIGSVRFRANTPGFTVETYAAKGAEIPPTITDEGWTHLEDQSDVGVEETLPVDGTFRHVLLWVTVQPADFRVGIPELELLE